ncbi:hypothetical protein DNTS_032039 [Danionella cerebrum]|uniref:Large ribosomal subunit protein bL9m n=1 Tax=Danionella cerebrum TaxID=2873325 RepID=A0A553P9H1_9TELE|nr:hypothetical protein DNTS_032039 [Danionella translucida]
MWAVASPRFVLQCCMNPSNVKSSLSRIQNLSQTACKKTVIVERWWDVPLAKEGKEPRLHPRRHKIYKLVEDKKESPKEKMELILTQTVPKLGGRGDTVLVKKSVGRNKLLAQGLAVYPSQENKDMFAQELKTVELLKRSELKVAFHTSHQYSLTKEIVSRQFLRELGIVVPVHALTLPEEPITGLGEFWCDVTVNKLDTVRVPMSVVPYMNHIERHNERMRLQSLKESEADPEPDAQLDSEPKND